MTADPVFWIIAAVMLGAAVVGITRRNLIHAALWLIGAWVGIAAFYLWAGAEFVAFAQVLVYVGAVSMVVLFAVLLTRQPESPLPLSTASSARAAGAVLAGVAAFGVIGYAILKTPLVASPVGRPLADAGWGWVPVSVRDIGQMLMGGQAGALLIVGVLLTVALLGAVVIAAGHRPPRPPP